MTKRFFAMNNGALCPFCLGSNLGTLEDQCTFLEVDRICNDCGKKFTEQHKISGYKLKEEHGTDNS